MYATTSRGAARGAWVRWAAAVCGLAAALGCSADDPVGSGAAKRILRVSGSGLLDLRVAGAGLAEQHSIAAWQAGSAVDGIVTTRVSRLDAGAATAFDFRSRIDCLVVEGNTAWIGATVTETSSGNVPLGERYLVLVRDAGDDGEDLLGAAFARDLGDAPCTDKPSQLTSAAVVLGDFAVGAGGAPVSERAFGTLYVAVTTVGALLDSDGYSVRLGAFAHQIGIGGRIVLPGLLPPGVYTVSLDDVAPNCQVQSPNPSGAQVLPGAPATVWFSVLCEAPPSTLRVVTRTTGGDIPNSFGLEVWYGWYDYYPFVTSIGANDTVDVGGRQPGMHTVTIATIPSNCRSEGDKSRDVFVGEDGATIEVRFAITCVARSSGRVSAASSAVRQRLAEPAGVARRPGL